MTNDVRRSASRVATLVALPVALLAGFIAFQALKPAPPKAQSTDPVTMPAKALSTRQSDVCRALLSRMPDQVRDRQRRQVTAGHEQNAAFGDPAITVQCGAQAPAFAPQDTVYAFSGVCWFPDAAGTTWTTVDREVPIAIVVPKDYDSPGQWVAAFSGPITATVPTANVPWGCKDDAAQ
jgi:hypothetical protein